MIGFYVPNTARLSLHYKQTYLGSVLECLKDFINQMTNGLVYTKILSYMSLYITLGQQRATHTCHTHERNASKASAVYMNRHARI